VIYFSVNKAQFQLCQPLYSELDRISPFLHSELHSTATILS